MEMKTTLEIKEEPKGNICDYCGSKNIVWSMNQKKLMCKDCSSFSIEPIFKRWVAIDGLIKCIDDTYKDLDMGKTIPIFIQRLKEKLRTTHNKRR